MGKTLKGFWTSCRARGRRDNHSWRHHESKGSWAPGSTSFFKAWPKSALYKFWASRTEVSSTQKKRKRQNFSPEACQDRTFWLYITCALSRSQLPDIALQPLKEDLLVSFPLSFFLSHTAAVVYAQAVPGWPSWRQNLPVTLWSSCCRRAGCQAVNISKGSEGSSFLTLFPPLSFVPRTLQHGQQAGPRAVLGFLLQARLSMGTWTGATASMHCNKQPHRSVDIKGSKGGEWLELLCQKETLIFFMEAADKGANYLTLSSPRPELRHRTHHAKYCCQWL